MPESDESLWTTTPISASNSSSIQAHYILEPFTYYYHPHDDPQNNHAQQQESHLQVHVKLATTTTGGRLVSETHDLTGIMLWPASHLMCQHLVQGDVANDDNNNNEEAVLELGCGCGLVSLVGVLVRERERRNDQKQGGLWMATDIDPEALQLCRQNFLSYGLDGDKTTERARIRSLAWGDDKRAQELLKELEKYHGKDDSDKAAGFDSVIGADIVYPDTKHETLAALFRTVETLLKPSGRFWLAFATRDGPRTPSRLLEAASVAEFAITRLPPLVKDIQAKLPPLLDSKLLVLRRSAAAREHNQLLGASNCEVFPGLRAAMESLENPSSDEEWEAPFAQSDEDEAT